MPPKLRGKWALGITPRHFTWILKDKLAIRAVGYQYEQSGYYRNVAGSDPAFQAAAGLANSLVLATALVHRRRARKGAHPLPAPPLPRLWHDGVHERERAHRGRTPLVAQHTI